MKQPAATRLAPPTTALAILPPEILPTLTDPATSVATLVVEVGMNTKSTSKPYFW